MLALYKDDIILYEKSLPKTIEPPTNGSMLKVQAVATKGSFNIQYKVVGRLHKLGIMKPLIGILDSDGLYYDTMSGSGVYSFDITGYKEISVIVTTTIGDPTKIIIVGTICRDI